MAERPSGRPHGGAACGHFVSVCFGLCPALLPGDVATGGERRRLVGSRRPKVDLLRMSPVLWVGGLGPECSRLFEGTSGVATVGGKGVGSCRRGGVVVGAGA